MKSLVTPQWHLIMHEKSGYQLYDWRRDTAEINNLMHTAESRATAQTLIDEVQARLRGRATPARRAPASPSGDGGGK
jgi:hypothetical protein